MKFDIVLRNCKIITIDENYEVLRNKNIGIKDGIIKVITEEEIEGVETIKCKGKIVMPGFVNSHTHIPMAYMRGYADDLPLKDWLEKHIWPTEAKIVKRDNVKWATMLGIAEMLSFGTSLFLDMYFFEDIVGEVVLQTGIRASLGEGILNFPTPSYKNPDEILSFTKSFARNYKNNEFIKVSVSPHSPYTCSEKVLKKSFELSMEYNLKMHIHVAETENERKLTEKEKGKSPVKYLNEIGVLNKNSILVHMIWVDEEEIDILREKGASVITCPESNAKLGSGVAPLLEYKKNKIKIGIGTDSVSSNNDLDILSDAKMAAYLQKAYLSDPSVFNAREVLSMLTKDAYSILGWKKAGIIKEGYKADMVIFNTSNPSSFPYFDPHSLILYSSTGREVETTIVNGKVLYNKGEYKTIDMERVKYEVKKRIKEMINI